jgi:adenylate kinase
MECTVPSIDKLERSRHKATTGNNQRKRRATHSNTMTTTRLSFWHRGSVLLLLLLSQTQAFVSRASTRAPSRYLPLAESAASSAKEKDTPAQQSLTTHQEDFCRGYLNKHHASTLRKFADAFSVLGTEMAQANARSGGSYTLQNPTLVQIDHDSGQLTIDVQVALRDNKETRTEQIRVPLNAEPIVERRRKYSNIPVVPDDANRTPLDDLVRRLNRLCWIVHDKDVTGRLTQLAVQLGGAGVGKLPESMYLNQVPHNRYVRDYFYQSVAQAVLDAVVLCSQGQVQNRMQIISQFPEMNPSMDSYRIGTILEMARTICIRLAENNVRVRLCVQASMGVGIFTGVPKQLSGVSKLVQMMDWQSDDGEDNVGMVGNYVNFGGVGAEHVQNSVTDEAGEIVSHQDDVFLLIAPQSMVGTDCSITPLLQAMVEAAGDRPVILMNPDLVDKPSAAGQQSVRGRQARIDFAKSFETIYQFKNIYVSGTSYFPILGATTKLHPSEPWVAHQRRDLRDGKGEIYVPVLSSESLPTGEDILEAFER